MKLTQHKILFKITKAYLDKDMDNMNNLTNATAVAREKNMNS